MDELTQTADIVHVKCLKKNIFKRLAKRHYDTKSGVKYWLDFNCNHSVIRMFCKDGEYIPKTIPVDVEPVDYKKPGVKSLVVEMTKLFK